MSARKAPDAEALRLAAEWLREFDDSHDDGEGTKTCAAVAEWLDRQAEAAELRGIARRHGVPVTRLRAKLKEQTANNPKGLQS